MAKFSKVTTPLSKKPKRVVTPTHDDLSDCCKILDPRDYEYDTDKHDCGSDDCGYHGEGGKSSSYDEPPYEIPGVYFEEFDELSTILYEENLIERIEATRVMLDKRPDLGLPYIAYARDSAESDAEIEEYYKKGLERLLNENDLFSPIDRIDEQIQDFDPDTISKDERNALAALKHERAKAIEKCAEARLGVYRFNQEGICLLTFELARFQWRHGRKEDAIATLQNTHKRLSLTEFNDYDSYVQPLLFNYLMQLNQLAEAQTVLDTQPDDSPLWYLCRALVLYAQSGDNMHSRSLLQMALAEDRHIASNLLSKKEEPAHKIRAFIEDSFEPVLYELRCAWHGVPGSSEWLAAHIAYFSSDALVQAALKSSSGKSKLKRWEADYTAAENAINKGDLSAAKNKARTALREVRSDLMLFFAFVASIKQVTSLSEAFPSLRDEALEHLRYHKKRELADSAETLERMERLMTISAGLSELAVYPEAAELQRIALDLSKTLIAAGDPHITTYAVSNVRVELGFSLGEMRKYSEARALFQENVDDMKNVLAEDHPHFVHDLDLLFRCLHKEGEHAKEEAVKAQLLRCTEHTNEAWEDTHKTHSETCPWFVGACV
ncbi:MAG TPA: hypothetical protein V6C97_12065 [Oculatellaceae cyanobacterium]